MRKAVLRPCVALISGLAVPTGSFAKVLGHSFAIFVQKAEIVFSIGITLIGSFAPRPGCLAEVLGHPLAAVVQQGEPGLCNRIALIGGLAEPNRRLFIILRCLFPIAVNRAQNKLRVRRDAIRAFPQTCQRF